MIDGVVFTQGRRSDERVDVSQARALAARDGTLIWLDVVEPDRRELEAIAAQFGLHPLTLEDAEERRQRSKVELYDEYAFVVLRPVSFHRDEDAGFLEHEMHVVAGPGYVVTIRFAPEWSLDSTIARWEQKENTFDSAFALYVLIDEVVDCYLGAIETLEDQTDDLEDAVFEQEDAPDGRARIQQRLFRLKRQTVRLRRFAMPLRQGIDLIQEQPALADDHLVPYLRDVMDHVIRVLELADNVRDILTSLLEVRVAQAANRLNEVMKKLTAWAGIILVPTLIAGIYGMNFDHLPELHWLFGYPFALGLMALSALMLYLTFKRNDWL
jgi:magnesium transporter